MTEERLIETPPGPTNASQAERSSGRPTDAQLRAQAQEHLDARRRRLDAYAAALEEQLANATTAESGAAIEGQLALVRRQIGASGRAQLPRASGADAADAPGAANARALAPLRPRPRAKDAAPETGAAAGTDAGTDD